ncbi:hexosaminidase [Arthrobacter woluwensis]|uniref:beta-N-acetylhexosaminidase n=1 Tax=Arthrobacter woluwensis TaxID=156980 RepID=UPI002785E030|nr:beta-N-acetylhexosaminidase [Arthrobacter woluwensis]MDQ0707757.1 hexosaminidase [Arthrobacter woluwensis]
MSSQHLITPAPRSTVTADGTLVLTSGTQVVAGPGAEAVAGAFAGWLRAGTGWAVPVLTAATGGPVISFGIDSAHPDGNEAYTLTVDDDGVRLSAAHAAGLFHASSSLRQLLPATLESGYTATPAEDIPLGHVEVRDAPRFAYRGIMLDVARSYYPIDEIRRLIDVMTRFKYNVLHLHLADDQSWRIELDTPEDNPTGIDFTELARIGKDGAVNREGWGLGPGRTGYYTKDDYRLIVAYAAERFVTVVPEFDVPGHVNSALAAIPELNPDGIATSPTATGEVGFSTLYNDNPLTRPFVAEVFRQLAELTPGPYLHLGGDEALVTSKEDFVAMVTDFAASVAATGKTVMGWNEYAQAELPSGAVIQYWDGDLEPTLRQVRENAARVVMSPGKGSYLDQKYVESDPIGLKWAAMGDWDLYYGWDPVRDGLEEDQVLGVEAPLWSETIRSLDEAHWLIYPRAIALAETAWSNAAAKNATEFASRLGGLGERLVALGVTFRPSPDIEWNATPRDPFEGVDLPAVTALPENAGVASAAGAAVTE